MKKLVFAVAIACASHAPLVAQSLDSARWEREARNVTIIRDDWGIPHVYGRTDADAVFGLMYAQAEDDFNRVEMNLLNAMGRMAEAEGASRIWQDLRMRLVVDPDSTRALYRASPPWLRRLMDAWADGLNFYLARHPEVRPSVLTRFEPWMALTFTEGSIGWDIERVDLGQLAAFYGGVTAPAAGDGEGTGDAEREPTGSNGIAIAPSRTAGHHALLLINPHTSFFFRAEAQVSSNQGLDAYGAVTWGQFFVYQGFNDRIGWMHTSSGVDNIDEYLETVTPHEIGYTYRYGGADLPIAASTITLRYRTPDGMAERRFTVYRTRHGPVVRRAGDRWVSVRLMHDPLHALIQAYTRTKARDYRAFRRIMDLHTNSSNNTIFASADGDIAYFHSNFIPRRDTAFDWTRPVDGSDPATDWHGVLSVDETPHVVNPPSGWLYNSNDWPWAAAGPDSPRRADFPAYVESGGPSARGRHAVRVLEHARVWTLDSLQAAAYDSYLPWFERTIPALVRAWDGTAATDPLKAKLQGQIELLRAWDLRWSVSSVPTSLAVFWGENASRRVGRDAREARMPVEDYVATRAAAGELLAALSAASDTLAAGFGTWRTPWGDINRFQRLTGDIVQPFSDSGPSIPVGFTSSLWGSLAAFGARAWPGTRKWYGTSGNSFVAVVEFGDSVRARAVTAGGENGHPGSPHFNDEAGRYVTGNLRDVYFYRPQLRGHTEREYHPGS
ncbi:MAG: penicillin acylase family protein [Gemmatimonadales bacterium]|jgi:acyl-homoserine lactone acylase PvdQ